MLEVDLEICDVLKTSDLAEYLCVVNITTCVKRPLCTLNFEGQNSLECLKIKTFWDPSLNLIHTLIAQTILL